MVQPRPQQNRINRDLPSRSKRKSPCKTGTTTLIQDTSSRDFRASERSVGRIHRGQVVRELEEEERAFLDILTPTPPARIDMVQTGPEEQMAERMRELPMPPLGPTPEPISLATPMSLLRPSFLKQLETITKTPFKTPGQEPIFRLPIASPTAVSIGTDTQGDPEVFGSMRSADKGTDTTSLAPRITRSAAKQTPGNSPRPKRVYFSPSKGSSSKRRR